MSVFSSEESPPFAGAEMGQSDQINLRKEYEKLFPVRALVLQELEVRVDNALASLPSRPKIKGRVKSFKSYSKKYVQYLQNGSSPSKMRDIVGIRVICTFLEDIAAVERILKESFKVLEVRRKGGNHSFREFGYESLHLLIAVPENMVKTPCCETAEIQIRTVMQNAWAEVEHELIYKAQFTPFDTPLKRKLAAVNASISLADIIFQEIRAHQRQLNSELGKRRESFFQKIEDSIDSMLYAEPAVVQKVPQLDLVPPSAEPVDSIDELLLSALYAHNGNQFTEAIAMYTRILEMKPLQAVAALIYKHRGMAYFACSCYEKAISDFSKSLELDPNAYKSAYYKGIVYCVLKRYSQAVDAFDLSMSISSYQPYCLYRRAQAYYHLEDYPQALGDCEAALALEPFEAARKFRDLLLNKLKM